MAWFPLPSVGGESVASGPIPVVEQEILDELQFHIEMRTLDNVSAGVPADDARQNAERQFGDFARIYKACRRTLLGERIMLQRVQVVLTLSLLVAVIFLGVQFYRSQQANQAATALMLKKLENFEKIAAQANSGGVSAAWAPDVPSIVATVPKTGDRNVDPAITEIRVTYNKQMMDGNWSWCHDPDQLKVCGDPHYEPDGKTCVLPVKLEPGKTYTIRLNTSDYRNFQDTAGKSAIPYVLQFKTRGTASGGPN